MSFLLCFWALIGWVNQVQINWVHDHIVLKLNESLSMVEDLPKASLFMDGEAINDPNVYYEKGVDRTFLSVVNTRVVAVYEVKYRVTFPTYFISQTHVIVFEVIDDIPPEILSMKAFEIPIGSKMPDLREGLRFQDNYDDPLACHVEILSHEVVLNKIGFYNITYIITDRSFNQTTGQTTLRIYDHIPPEIILKTPITLEFSTLFHWKQHLTIKDNYDAWIEPIIDDTHVNYDELGQYPLIIYATDSSQNTTVLQTSIHIVDTIAPVIVFKSNPKPIAVHEDLTRAYLEDFVLSVSDNHSNLTHDDLIITYDIDTSRLGAYRLYVTVYDQSGNRGFNQLTIHVVDHEKPTISLKEPLIFLVFETKPHLLDFFLIEDNYEAYDGLSITLSGTFHMHLVGSYLITVTATDQSKNKATAYFHLKVIDVTPPTVTLKQTLVITDFKPIPLNLYIDVSDNYDKISDLIITIDDTKIHYEKRGIYPFTVCAYDLSLNVGCETFEIFIVDITAPKIDLKHDHITIDTTIKSLDYSSFIQSVYDNYDDLQHADVIIDSQIKYGVIGLYKVIYRVSDQSDNETTQVLHVRIDHFEPLHIYSMPLKTTQLKHVDLLEGLYIDTDTLNYEVVIETSHITFEKPGTYEFMYIIIDERGNQYVEKNTITIEADNVETSYKSYIPLIAINTVGLALLGWLTFQRRLINVFDNDEG